MLRPLFALVVGVAVFLSILSALPSSLFWFNQLSGNFIALLVLAHGALLIVSILRWKRAPFRMSALAALAILFLWYFGSRVPFVLWGSCEERYPGVVAEGEGSHGPSGVFLPLMNVTALNILEPTAEVENAIAREVQSRDLVFVLSERSVPIAKEQLIASDRREHGGVQIFSNLSPVDVVDRVGAELPPAAVARLASASKAEVWVAAFLTARDTGAEPVYQNRLVSRRIAMQFRHSVTPVLVVARMHGNAFSPRVRDFMRAGFLSNPELPAAWLSASDPLALFREDLTIFVRGLTLASLAREQAPFGEIVRFSVAAPTLP